MLCLRWLLGSIAVVVFVGWLGLALIADHFRRSFGASGVDPVLVSVPPIGAVLILLTVLMPHERLLMHAAAALLGIAAAGFILLLRKTAAVGGFGLAGLGLWFVFYWQACLH